MATADQVIARARLHLGEDFGPESYAYLGMRPSQAAWCAAYASWVYDSLGVLSAKSSSTTEWVRWAQRLGRWRGREHTPLPGDAILYLYENLEVINPSNPPVNHIGIVESIESDGTIHSVEGNLGDRVKAISHPKSHFRIRGFITMPLERFVPPTPPEPTPIEEEEEEMTFIAVDRGSSACWLVRPGRAPEQVKHQDDLSALASLGIQSIHLSWDTVASMGGGLS